MKFIEKLLWVLFSPVVFASPVQVDVNIRLEVEDAPKDATKVVPVRPLAASTTSSCKEEVTLITEIHIPSKDKRPNQSFYAYENIPYARQPIGKRRFKQAEALDYEDEPDELPVNDGSKDVVCPQEQPGWFPFAGKWSAQLFNTLAKLDERFEEPIYPSDYKDLDSVKPTANQSEECLVLDVFVPKRLFCDADVPLKPVIVSFHGGGFVYGSKAVTGSPAGILEVSGKKGVDEDVIVVSVNYRLGAFGWLGGEEFRNQGGYENAGLSDQNVALDWVYNNINLFGGDPGSITVLGESAGASSILHHLAAYGFDRSYKPHPRFSRAILQSPAFFPETSQQKMKTTYENFLHAADVKNFEELQKATTETLIKANRKTVYESKYGTFTYGPVVSAWRDPASYVQVPPALKIQTGVWFSQVDMIIANNRREGSIFTPPWIRNESILADYMREIYPTMTNESFGDFAKLYPVPQDLPRDGLIPPRKTTERERFLYGAAAFGDLGADCNAWELKKRCSKQTSYQYYYRLYPSFHGQDVGATWWPEAGENLTKLNVELQSKRLQRWLTYFAKGKAPSTDKPTLEWEFKPINEDRYGSDKAMFIGDGSPDLIGPDQDYFMSAGKGGMPNDEICEFWNSAPYWEPDPEAAKFLQVQQGWNGEL